MTFIRSKTVKGQQYFYLVDGVREGDKVRQRVLVYLGKHKTVRGAHAYWQKQAEAGENATTRRRAREKAKKLQQYM